MATPKKIKGASFGEECMDFMKNCEGKKNGTNDNFVRNFNIFGVERNGKSNVIDRLEHLSVINHGEKNAAEHVCDQLLKDKSSLFYSKTKIEERMGVWEDGKQKYSKKTSRQEAIGFAHFFSDCLEDKNINDLLELSMNELLNVAIPCLKAKKQFDLDVLFLENVVKPVAEWLKDWKDHRKLRLITERKAALEKKIKKFKALIDVADDDDIEDGYNEALKSFEKKLEECKRQLLEIEKGSKEKARLFTMVQDMETQDIEDVGLQRKRNAEIAETDEEEDDEEEEEEEDDEEAEDDEEEEEDDASLVELLGETPSEDEIHEDDGLLTKTIKQQARTVRDGVKDMLRVADDELKRKAVEKKRKAAEKKRRAANAAEGRRSKKKSKKRKKTDEAAEEDV